MVEVGAFDGITYSNTLLFENEFETSAYLVEPSPLNASRVRHNRPKSQLLELAVASDFSVAEFAGHEAVSGITDRLTAGYKEKWAIDQLSKYSVVTIPMWAAQKIIGSSYIDFLSIDVQGAERGVLETMDWSIPVGIICLELEGHHPSDDEACRQILASKGYTFKARLKISEIWVNDNYFRGPILYDPTLSRDISYYEISQYSEMHLPDLLHLF